MATNRSIEANGGLGTGRSAVLRYAEIDVAIPGDRQVAASPFTATGPTFSVQDSRPIKSTSDLAESLAMESGSDLTLWVHGFNMTPAEAVYRQAQMAEDFGMTGPQVAFVWATAERGIGYLHDRDSVLYARGHFEELVRLLARSTSGRIMIVALSLGSLLVMETLRQAAIDNGQLFTNAAHGVRIIKSSRIDHKAPVPSKEMIRALIEAADEDFKPHLIVSALGGLRASELRGLRWLDVDFDKGFLHIRQRADAYNQMGEPKSQAGFRDIPAGPMVLNALRRWKLRCPKSDLGLVFPAPRGGILQHTNTQARFRKLQEKVEVTMRWHDLRHFAVSLWIEQGFSIKEIMAFAGHSSIQMTMERYGHLFPSPDHQKAMAMVEAKLLG